MQLPIPSPKFLVLKEKVIIHQRQCVEHVKLVFLCQNQRIIDQSVEAFLKIGACEGRVKTVFGGVVEEVRGADILVLVMVDNAGFETVEGEEVEDFVGGMVLVFISIKL